MTTAMQRWMQKNPDTTVVNDSSEDIEKQTNWNDPEEAKKARQSGGDPESSSTSTASDRTSGITDATSFSPGPNERQEIMDDAASGNTPDTSTTSGSSSDDTASVEVTDVQSTRSPSAQERQRARNSDDSLQDVVQESRKDNDPDAEDVVAGMPTNAIETVLRTGDPDTNIGSDDVTIGDVAETVGVDRNVVGTGTPRGSGDSSSGGGGGGGQNQQVQMLRQQVATLQEELSSVTQTYNTALAGLMQRFGSGSDRSGSSGGLLSSPIAIVAAVVVAIVAISGGAIAAGGD